jgi:hypothetical protein
MSVMKLQVNAAGEGHPVSGPVYLQHSTNTLAAYNLEMPHTFTPP